MDETIKVLEENLLIIGQQGDASLNNITADVLSAVSSSYKDLILARFLEEIRNGHVTITICGKNKSEDLNIKITRSTKIE